MVLISVITPCFNHGVYLDEAIDSIQLSKYADIFEHIIINDGSTDEFTIKKLAELEAKGSIVLHQQNLGLAAARNKGIEHATGIYILPLDCDNKIVPDIFIEAAKEMEADKNIDVAYTDAYYFGNLNEKRVVGPFDGIRLLLGNYIDACALIRKETLIQAGLYEGGMPGMGTEDWELWVKLFLHDKIFHYLPKTGYYYRVVSDSMSVNITRPNLQKNKKFIYHKHAALISERIHALDYANKAMTGKIEDFNNLLFLARLKIIVKLILGRKVIY